MDREILQKKLLENFKLAEYFELIKEGKDIIIEELWDSPKALIASLALQASHKHVVIITSEKPSNHLFEDLSFFSNLTPLEFPSTEVLPGEDLDPSSDLIGERFAALEELTKNQTPHLILTNLAACIEKVPTPEALMSLMLEIKEGDTISFSQFSHDLTDLGYHRTSICSDKGTYSIRGGIIDLFPTSAGEPYRIEFFGDEIVSIRKFDPISQISVGKIDRFILTPGHQKEESNASLFSYLKRAIVIFDDIALLEDKVVKWGLKIEEFLEAIKPLQKVYLTNEPLETLSEVTAKERKTTNVYADKARAVEISFEAFNKAWGAKRWRHPFMSPKEDEEMRSEDFLKDLLSSPFQLIFLNQYDSEEKALKEKIARSEIARPEIYFEKGALSSGFCLKEPPLAIIPQSEFKKVSFVRRTKKRSHYNMSSSEMLAINPGEAIVHMNSGIGRYLGIEKRPNHLGVDTEFLLVEYAEGAKLYVPIEQTHLISKYIGTGEEKPDLHQLGSSRWKNALARSEKAIQGYAQDLLRMQAERQLKGGFVYPPHSELLLQFSQEFPYQETPDQLKAIQNVFEDMMSKLPMDRLICGDVGYGKTEVAMRAAFKAVVDGGKQVAVLVPTTVLAMQHYETFCARMSGFPIRIGVLSRFCPSKEIKQTIEECAVGNVDIVIGTHRLVSDDILFKDLGLIIIDEEQRFGVKAKEHLKKFKKEVDCLTMTATPIPRTLYMSLSGAREMSLINTPPEDRLPIQSFITQASDDVIKNALLRELSRDGQAYVIHNRVESIFECADRVRKLLPEARIVVGHGQMGAHELDAVFHAFKNGNADILVATSIIENGIDIPNANTILIDRADRFGMADLYQMRGRVGRWNKKAYCYFMVPSPTMLNEITRKRLNALMHSSGFGGGMKVAMHDLELRGAGNILGTEQSGHIASIGFTLYCKLLKKAIQSLQKKGTPFALQADVKLELPYDARLTDHYVNEVSLRLEIYQRLGEAENEHEVDMLKIEMEDRFGKPPLQAEWLFAISKIRLFAAQNRFTLIKLTKVVLYIEQTIDKKKVISKKLIIKEPKTPEELKEMIISSLKNNFILPS